MPVGMCGSCRRFISISLVPGGNPMAITHPDLFAATYAMCDRCHKPFCDQCVANAGGKCPECGKRLELQGPPPGEANVPPAVQEMLRKLDAQTAQAARKPAAPPPSAPKEKEAGAGQAALRWLGAIAVIAAASGLAIWRLPQASLGHRMGWWGLKGLGVFAVAVIVAPAVGNLVTATVGEIVRRMVKAGALLKFTRFLLVTYFLVLLASPLFIYHAHYALSWPGWRVAYVYGAIVGALLGGIILLGKYTKSLQEHLRGS